MVRARNTGGPDRTWGLLAVLLPVLALAGCTGKAGAAATPGPTAAPTPPPPTVLEQTEDMGRDYINSFVFLGDSTTYGLAYYELLPRAQVWTPASGTLTLSDWAVESIEYYDGQDRARSLSIAEAAALRRPAYLVITLGLNGISFLEEDDFKSYYTALIQAVQAASPDTKIICNSIYPVIGSQVSAGLGNDRINAANAWIESVAGDTGVRYLNTHDLLTDENDDLRADYCNGDGIHLSPEGFETVLWGVRTHGCQ